MHSLLKRPEAGTLTDARAQWLRKIKPAEELFDNQTVPPGGRKAGAMARLHQPAGIHPERYPPGGSPADRLPGEQGEHRVVATGRNLPEADL